MADNEVQYEFKTVKAIRGAEARSTSKWENEGWEFVSQDKGTLRSEITFRRPKRKTPWRLFAVGGGIALLIAAAITVGAIQDGSGNAAADPVASPAQTKATEEAGPASASPEASPSEQASETAETAEPEEVLTVENSSDLAALLAITDHCSEPVAVFAAQNKGKTIAFDGSIGAMNPHGDYKTRYDILIGAGDFSETTSPGPAFQFRDVNATSDMHFTDTNRPDTVGVGDNLRVTARVVGFEESSCLFLLDPVRTSFR
ncbi:DUF4839 domain-containing protein [Arthrobacter sp. Helios]|uniref:DUF4839 domain-containing protein n=1 Tax=Arthrobacter sp. Helios TaxID=2828862 RepID=UPI00206A6B2E|nr:DUF4839 domain-containing protein [Arthrobacter sp. Helios]UPO76398.1 DUF4839 domain-containing protein [Arthrobacter sp. Helios]